MTSNHAAFCRTSDASAFSRHCPSWATHVRVSGAAFIVWRFQTHVRFGVALGNAGKVGVVAFLDYLLVKYEGCSISLGSIGLHSYMRIHYSVNWSLFILLKYQYSTKFPSSVALVGSLHIFKDFVALEMRLCICNHLLGQQFSPFLIVEHTETSNCTLQDGYLKLCVVFHSLYVPRFLAYTS